MGVNGEVMTIPRIALFAAIFSSSLFSATETGIEFAGVLTAEGKTRIALTDTARKSTTWVEPGSEFNGYTVVRYDAKEEAVFLKKNGRETRVGMVTPKTRETPATASAAAATSQSAQATTTAIRANLRQLISAARQYQVARGVTSVSYTDLVGPDKLIKELKPVAGENYSTLSFGPNVTAVSVTTANGATVSFEVTPATATAAANSAATPAPQSPAAATTTPSSTATPSGGTVPASPATAPANATSEALPPTSRQSASPSYTIQGGDTWQKISETTGVPVSQLRQLNPAILEGSPLPSGQTIRVR